ncbi:MAG: hypothetical protein WCV00_09115 [Verrucomicrobiia bacterium]
MQQQKTVTLCFNEEDNTENMARFKLAFHAALQYVEELHPGSIAAAVKKQQQLLSKKDPRFDVSISVEKGVQKVNLKPKSPVSLNLQLRGKKEDFERLVERGMPTEFKAGRFAVSGSPLLEEIAKDQNTNLVIRFGREVAGSVRFHSRNGDVIAVVDVDGRFQCGTRFAAFRSSWPASPFRLQFTVSIDDVMAARPFKLATGFDFLVWQNHPVLQLPYYDRTRDVVASLCSVTNSRIEVFVMGNSICSAIRENPAADECRTILNIFEWLEKCRWLALHLNVNPRLPLLTEITDEQWDNVEFLYRLLKEGVWRQDIAGISFTINVDQKDVPMKAEDSKPSELLMLDTNPRMIDFLGVPVAAGRLKQVFTEVRLVQMTAEVDGSKLTFQAEKSSTRMIQVAAASDFSEAPASMQPPA